VKKTAIGAATIANGFQSADTTSRRVSATARRQAASEPCSGPPARTQSITSAAARLARTTT